MKPKILKLSAALLAAAALSACASLSAPFKSSNTGPGGYVLPYTSYASYYGYIAPGQRADGTYQGKKAYYIYFWVPAAIDEVGVGMWSPAGNPGGGDFVSPTFKAEYGKDPNAFFDTFLVLERLSIVEADKIKNGGAPLGQPLATNDDSSEMPANPDGSFYNSLLRVQTSTSEPTRALVRGVYRITLTSFRGDVKGSFVASVGTNIPGVKVAASLAELHALVNAE